MRRPIAIAVGALLLASLPVGASPREISPANRLAQITNFDTGYGATASWLARRWPLSVDDLTRQFVMDERGPTVRAEEEVFQVLGAAHVVLLGDQHNVPSLHGVFASAVQRLMETSTHCLRYRQTEVLLEMVPRRMQHMLDGAARGSDTELQRLRRALTSASVYDARRVDHWVALARRASVTLVAASPDRKTCAPRHGESRLQWHTRCLESTIVRAIGGRLPATQVIAVLGAGHLMGFERVSNGLFGTAALDHARIVLSGIPAWEYEFSKRGMQDCWVQSDGGVLYHSSSALSWGVSSLKQTAEPLTFERAFRMSSEQLGLRMPWMLSVTKRGDRAAKRQLLLLIRSLMPWRVNWAEVVLAELLKDGELVEEVLGVMRESVVRSGRTKSLLEAWLTHGRWRRRLLSALVLAANNHVIDKSLQVIAEDAGKLGRWEIATRRAVAFLAGNWGARARGTLPILADWSQASPVAPYAREARRRIQTDLEDR